MRKSITMLIFLLVVSNGVWAYIYNAKQSADTLGQEVKLYKLNGDGRMWDVKDYVILVTPSKIYRGNATLTYKGDSKEIEESDFYMYTFTELDVNNNRGGVLASSHVSRGGSISIIENLKEIGSITSPYSYGEIQKNRRHYDSTQLEIKWNDNMGTTHKETIELDIVSEVVVNQDGEK